jgi:urate oxidase
VARLLHNSYGKSRVRLTKVTRRDDRHDLTELSVDIELEGDFEATYTEGDNRKVVATDSMKNTVYVLAREHGIESIEAFALHLARHFVERYDQVEAATVHIAQDAWLRAEVDGRPHPTTFIGGSREKRTCTVSHTRGATLVEAGIEDLLVLKTTDSAFEDFVSDEFRTLPDAADRILATSVTARWTYDADDHDWNECFGRVRAAMLEVFARHFSRSVQETLHLMGSAALEACPHAAEITLELPNSHRIPFNLSPFGLDNPNAIFVPTDEPFGLITGTLTRD